MRALLRSNIRAIGLSRMGVPFNSLPSNFGFLVRFQSFILRMLMVMEEWQSHAWNLSSADPSVACIKDSRMSV